MFAHLTKTSYGFEITITDSNRPVGGTVYQVKTKADARKLCKMHGATPWNF